MPAPFSPGRLGADFTRLWTASTVSNLGDGVTGVAGPLLVASLTDSPALVAGAALAQRLPWLLFSLPAGAWVDRLDQRRLLVAVNLARGALLGGLTLAVWTGTATIPILYVTFFLFGTGETLSDSTSVALVPSIVPAEGLARANARLLGTYLVGNQLLAPPFGAWLFVVVPALPFAFDAVSFLAAALLVAPLVGRVPARAREDRGRALRVEIAEGLGWLWRHRTLRLLAVCVAVMNLAGAGSFAIWVLWARERLGLEGVGFGALITAYAVGGVLGTSGRTPGRPVRPGRAAARRSVDGGGRPAGAGPDPRPLGRGRHPGAVRHPRHRVGGGQHVAAPADRAGGPARAGQQRLFPVRPRRSGGRHPPWCRARLRLRHHRPVLAWLAGRGPAGPGKLALVSRPCSATSRASTANWSRGRAKWKPWP